MPLHWAPPFFAHCSHGCNPEDYFGQPHRERRKVCNKVCGACSAWAGALASVHVRDLALTAR